MWAYDDIWAFLTMALINCTPLLSQYTKFLRAAIFECNKLHTSSVLQTYETNKTPRHWLEYNKKIYPPQQPNEEPRPAVRMAF